MLLCSKSHIRFLSFSFSLSLSCSSRSENGGISTFSFRRSSPELIRFGAPRNRLRDPSRCLPHHRKSPPHFHPSISQVRSEQRRIAIAVSVSSQISDVDGGQQSKKGVRDEETKRRRRRRQRRRIVGSTRSDQEIGNGG